MNNYLIDTITSPLAIGVLELPFSPLRLLLGFILPLFLAFVLYKLSVRLSRKLLGKTKLKEEAFALVLKWIKIVLRLLSLVLLVGLVASLFGAKLLEYWKLFYKALNQPLLKSGGTSISFVTLILTIPIFYLANWAGRGVKGVMNHSLLKRIGIDEAKQFSISNLLRYTVMIIVLLIGLSIIGIDLSALTVIFGVLGIGLGFGLQGVVGNFFAGLVIIITRPIKEGDFVVVDGLEGTVVHIRIIATVINTIRNETIIVPNSELVSKSVYNNSYEDRSVIIRNDIGVAYKSDVEQVQTLLEQVAEACPLRVRTKPPVVRLKEFGNSSVNFAVFTMIRDVEEKYEAHHWINMAVWKAFKREGVEIPFPQLDLYIKEGIKKALPETKNRTGDSGF
jgi:potassium-dependent mechanosensitive channel